MTTQPATVEEVQDAIRDRARLHVRGGGTKSTPPGEGVVLDLARLSGITEYSPAECVMTMRAGTTVVDIETTLAAEGQYLPFDPPFAAKGATIGGTVASGVSGPRRYRYGGVRDFLIGVRVVDGDGRLIRSGGKVVKNAAGFLLHHGMVGSLGQFGVLTELTFKVFPQPEARRTITAECGSVANAFAAACEVGRLRRDCESIDFDEGGTLRLGLAGRASAIGVRSAALAEAARSLPSVVGVDVHDSWSDPHISSAAIHDSRSDPRISSAAIHDSWSDPPGTACVKVAGLMNSWQNLHQHVTAARFMCAGSVAWLFTDRLADLADALRDAHLTGLVLRGPRAGTRVGHLVHNEFEERVRRVLDPHNKFRAAPDSRR
jgi:glycolate oxidase FAD binding subunit